MPKNTPAPKGAKKPAGARGTAKSAHTKKKLGGPSAKHRGYTPDAEARGGKKPRWSAEERTAKGRAADRPRGTRDDRNAEDGRPNWEPRGKAARATVERAPAERRRDHGGDSRPRYDRAERPARDERGERPERRYDRDDRAARYDRSDRPARADRDERPARYDRDERPARFDRATRSDRPTRNDRDDRPARYDRSERPARAHGDRPHRLAGDRPHRSSYVREDDTRRGGRYDARTDRTDRFDRGERAERRPIAEDVVLERLEAQAVEAAEVAGTFADLGLGQNIVRALAELGAETPFPIQSATIPDALAGRDVLGRGRTGSGKTIAFGAPIVERLMQLQAGEQKRRQPGRAPRALILAPTRELALQIDRTVQPIARSVGLFTTQIYGGVPFARQLGALDRGVDIVIGTPGRVQDLANRGKLDLSNVQVAVLDEADHMCELGFAEVVTEILDQVDGDAQKLLFSATLDTGVADIVERYLQDPAVYEVAGEDQASSTIEHRVLLLDQRDKQDVLVELAAGPGKKLVFARTRAFAEQLADLLDDHGIRSEPIHGDLTQSRRERAIEKFANGRVSVLVATDVAARGIHVDDVTLVIQADAPDEYKAYLHRSGRTGRAGKTGTVVTLVPRNRRRRTEDLLKRAEIVAEWTPVAPGDALIEELAGR
ncbi:DEAD/DEAH box helicase [Homoserinibacter sp. GY 40078]|uniref:DEAD/DEAH box helicase n=1 Tax=Homoserinibacter sp. GY 40078 TaxID=2603275 RepID=UPI0011CC4E84|nr:DEAD/DEAH box helicase [Homoserinibacter sp. GY 40078]TXK18711.1 DEAD/DEAH box helicase [Homoserinibacter sp. GY 40078]